MQEGAARGGAPFLKGPSTGWTAPAALLALIRYERGRTDPLVDVEIFRDAGFSGAGPCPADGEPRPPAATALLLAAADAETGDRLLFPAWNITGCGTTRRQPLPPPEGRAAFH
ncbi:hypothetical protein AB0I22_04665 [Streptomyces sp. NPDC050610]|uniref:hypothetical protein n=1 Tax=Streptomyces sp. NPDC050610 TaxID=3157097 RepID=UPI003446E779